MHSSDIMQRNMSHKNPIGMVKTSIAFKELSGSDTCSHQPDNFDKILQAKAYLFEEEMLIKM